MNDDPVLQELEETGQRLWKEGGETVDGFFDLCNRIAEQARAEYALYGDRWRGVGREPAPPDWKATPSGEPMCVKEGEAPKYGAEGEKSDLARKGEEGEAE